MLALVDDHKGADRIFKILVDGEVNIGLRQCGRFKGAEGHMPGPNAERSTVSSMGFMESGDGNIDLADIIMVLLLMV